MHDKQHRNYDSYLQNNKHGNVNSYKYHKINDYHHRNPGFCNNFSNFPNYLNPPIYHSFFK